MVFLLVEWSIPKLIGKYLAEKGRELSVIETERWMTIQLQEMAREPRNRRDLSVNLGDIRDVRKKISLFPQLKEQINTKLLLKMEKRLREKTCSQCSRKLEPFGGELVCPNCGVSQRGFMLDDFCGRDYHHAHNKVPYHKIRCLKMNIKQLLGNFAEGKWLPIYEQIKRDLKPALSLLELREIMKKKGKSKSYPMANAILFHHISIRKSMNEVEKDALFHLFSIYHDGYVQLSKRPRKTMRFGHFLLKILPCLKRDDLCEFVVDIKDENKKKKMNLLFRRICRKTKLKDEMKRYRAFFSSTSS
ncbi:MAG: hypothetical protein U9P79_06800 [Candidatus Cloacimonadota bacterium]|nr:hypothetical protein [Candidatus Cloacimonadota bacterium]